MTKPAAKVKTLALPRAADLLRWYDHHGRDLPWRVKGRHPAPYQAWLAEIMLQQTTVPAVIPYYHKFLERWPTVVDLAAASLGEVRAAWAGLGYYRRAANLHRCAQIIAGEYGGRFPEDVAGLKELPGIGDYTAAAVAAIAFDKRANVVDGNVERVMARVFEIGQALRTAKTEIRHLAEQLLPTRRYGDYAQALMDLGATVCVPRQPRCPECPWRASCGAYQHGTTGQFPVAAVKTAKPVRRAVAFWLENAEGAVWLRLRPENGLLGGMVEVPSSPWLEQEMPDLSKILEFAPAKRAWKALPQQVRHSFTHFDLYLQIVHAKGPAAKATGFWAKPAAFKSLALPSVMRKVCAAVAMGRTK